MAVWYNLCMLSWILINLPHAISCGGIVDCYNNCWLSRLVQVFFTVQTFNFVPRGDFIGLVFELVCVDLGHSFLIVLNCGISIRMVFDNLIMLGAS